MKILYFFSIIFFLVACRDNSDDLSIGGNWSRVANSYAPMVSRELPVTFHVQDRYYVTLGKMKDAGMAKRDREVFRIGKTEGPQIKDFPGASRQGAVAFTLGRKVYVGLGQGIEEENNRFYKDFWVYDDEQSTWDSLKLEFPAGLVNASAFSVGGKGYIVAGRQENGSYSDAIYWLDPEFGWVGKISDLPPREGATVFEADGKIYLCFGRKESTYCEDVYSFVPETSAWHRLADIPENRMLRAFAPSFVISVFEDHQAYIAGGESPVFTQDSTGYCCRYDCRKDSWSWEIPFPENDRVAFACSENGAGYVYCKKWKWEFTRR